MANGNGKDETDGLSESRIGCVGLTKWHRTTVEVWWVDSKRVYATQIFCKQRWGDWGDKIEAKMQEGEADTLTCGSKDTGLEIVGFQPEMSCILTEQPCRRSLIP